MSGACPGAQQARQLFCSHIWLGLWSDVRRSQTFGRTAPNSITGQNRWGLAGASGQKACFCILGRRIPYATGHTSFISGKMCAVSVLLQALRAALQFGMHNPTVAAYSMTAILAQGHSGLCTSILSSPHAMLGLLDFMDFFLPSRPSQIGNKDVKGLCTCPADMYVMI